MGLDNGQEAPIDPMEVPRDDEARLDELDQDTGDMFRDPASLEAYKAHIAKVPTRENFQPGTKERSMAAIGAMFNDPQDQGKYIKERLDRPYNEATEQYERVGKGLKDTIGAEESSLNRQRLGAQYESGLEERRQGRLDRNEDKDLDRQQRIEDTKQKYAALAEAATSKVEAARILQEGRMEIARLSADTRRDVASMVAAGKKSDERNYNLQPELDAQGAMTGRSYDPRKGTVIETPEGKGMRLKKETDKMRITKTSGNNAIKKATELQTIFHDLQKEGGGSTSHVGWGQGGLSAAGTKIGAVSNPKVIKLHALAQDLANNELYKLSGAQINNKEYDRLRQTLANPNHSEAEFETLIQQFIDFHRQDMEGLFGGEDDDDPMGLNK